MNNHADVYAYTDDAVAANLARIMNEIVEATVDAALLERLKASPARIVQLTAEQDALIAQQRTLAAAKAKAAEDARFAGFTDIQVTDKFPHENVLRTSFEISWMALTWDSSLHESVPKRTTMNGFAGLPQEVLNYLIERHPHKVPAKIIALAPNLYDAFNRYFVGMKRGHLTANSYDVQGSAGA